MTHVEQTIEQVWQQAMRTLIKKLKEADRSFAAAEHDRLGMRNFIRNVTHPAWKQVIEQSQDEVNIILVSLQEPVAA